MSYFLWRETLPGVGIAVTVDRLFILGVAVVTLLAVVLGRVPWRSMPGVVSVLAALIVYFTVSMLRAGMESIADVSPHFRLIGGYIIPTIVLVICFLAFRQERQLSKWLWFFFVFGAYLTFTAWAEQLHLWSLVFPTYIRDPDLGIHWGRSRGPFLVAVTLGYTLIFCFYSNLVLAARTAGAAKLMIYAVNALTVPAIFFTQTRSVWLAMVLCTIVWVMWSRRTRSVIGTLSLLLAVGLVIGVTFWGNILSRDRTVGGVTDPYPIDARIGLAKMSAQLIAQHPVTGVGFGHFRDAASALPGDPSSKYLRFSSRLMEHNNFLSVATETGVVGLVLYVIVLWMLFRVSVRVYRRLSPTGDGWMTREFVLLYWILLIDYVVDATFRETSVDPFNNGLLFAVSGIILAMDRMLSSETVLPLGPSPMMPSTAATLSDRH
jgi:O-antigen ligase